MKVLTWEDQLIWHNVMVAKAKQMVLEQGFIAPIVFAKALITPQNFSFFKHQKIGEEGLAVFNLAEYLWPQDNAGVILQTLPSLYPDLITLEDIRNLQRELQDDFQEEDLRDAAILYYVLEMNGSDLSSYATDILTLFLKKTKAHSCITMAEIMIGDELSDSTELVPTTPEEYDEDGTACIYVGMESFGRSYISHIPLEQEGLELTFGAEVSYDSLHQSEIEHYMLFGKLLDFELA